MEVRRCFENIELSPDSYKKMATLSKRMFDIFEGIHDSFIITCPVMFLMEVIRHFLNHYL